MICIGWIDWVTSYEVIKYGIIVVDWVQIISVAFHDLELHWRVDLLWIFSLCLVDGAEAIVVMRLWYDMSLAVTLLLLPS